ncbi:lysostaphin resistance A-like protein [Microbacterium sp. PMB16]|uniref:CPBP family intramembrane glutamic endopeptidase n=1 Tax=Microbacterium sp. PMB16 TaxID=3120157 RepID=UPI003F4C077D
MALPAVVIVLALSVFIGPTVAMSSVPKGNYLLYGLVVLGVLLAVTLPVLALFGWLRAVFFEEKRVGGLLPTLLAFGPVLYIVYCIVTTRWSEVTLDIAVTTLVLAAIAGVGEELAFRGVAVVTLRARLSEVWVAVIPAVVFGLIHLIGLTGEMPAINVFYQVGYAILFGFTAYAIRRVTGGLLIPILIHTANNAFDTIADESVGGPFYDFDLVSDGIFIGGLVLGTIAMILIVRNRANDPKPFVLPATTA